jgi:hypothetical protein
MLGAFFAVLSFTSAVFEFPAASLTLIVRVHSSDIVVHLAIDFQFRDNVTLQFLLTLSDHDATKTSQI